MIVAISSWIQPHSPYVPDHLPNHTPDKHGDRQRNNGLERCDGLSCVERGRCWCGAGAPRFGGMFNTVPPNIQHFRRTPDAPHDPPVKSHTLDAPAEILIAICDQIAAK